jgi:hypothetical protein
MGKEIGKQTLIVDMDATPPPGFCIDTKRPEESRTTVTEVSIIDSSSAVGSARILSL